MSQNVRNLALDTIVFRLTQWGQTHDNSTRNALDLLIEHDVWLRRNEFVYAPGLIKRSGETIYLMWPTARKLFDRGAFKADDVGTEDLNVLDFAIALGEDRYGFNKMGVNSAMLVTAAVARALRDDSLR